MEKINNLFDSRVDLVCDNYSSVFTKDDVLSLLSRLRADVLTETAALTPVNSISEMDFQEFSCNVTKALEQSLNNGTIEPIDYDSAEFKINYSNQIEIECINVDTEGIADELSDILLEQFQESFGRFITSETEN
jgi:Na+-transporting NADH:ubiquinone oxidoreductase subunit NqrA